MRQNFAKKRAHSQNVVGIADGEMEDVYSFGGEDRSAMEDGTKKEPEVNIVNYSKEVQRQEKELLRNSIQLIKNKKLGTRSGSMHVSAS
jgi:hypothetical protein